jgi:hypothetical protein
MILLRKGGIREPSGAFGVEHRAFFLFPTYFHANEEDLVPGLRARLPAVNGASPPAGQLRLELFATVESVAEVDDLDRLRRLDGEHGLTWPAVERRFRYRRPGLHVIAVRAYRLAEPLVVSNLARYDGCRSWVPLASELSGDRLGPAVADGAFAERLAAVRGALTGPG